MTVCSDVLAKLREGGFKVGSSWRKVVKTCWGCNRNHEKWWEVVAAVSQEALFPPLNDIKRDIISEKDSKTK